MSARQDLERLLDVSTWVTSDHHWSHANIRKYQGRPENHFELMRDRWKERVQPRDIVLHLGDLVCYGNQAEHFYFLRGLPGRKYLLRGNHDKHPAEWYETNGFAVLGERPITWVWEEQLVLFSHRPDDTEEHQPWDVNIHGHIHANPYWSSTPAHLDYRNVCVEVTDYAPVRLGAVLDGTAGQRRK